MQRRYRGWGRVSNCQAVKGLGGVNVALEQFPRDYRRSVVRFKYRKYGVANLFEQSTTQSSELTDTTLDLVPVKNVAFEGFMVDRQVGERDTLKCDAINIPRKAPNNTLRRQLLG